MFKKSKDISTQIDKLSKTQLEVKNKLDDILSTLPNLPLNDVPTGKDENSNIELSKSGTRMSIDMKTHPHPSENSSDFRKPSKRITDEAGLFEPGSSD